MKAHLFSVFVVGGSFVLLASTARAGVHTVGGAGGMFGDIQSAVNAAVDDDTILVRPGIYAGFTVDHKSLFIAADPPGSVTTGVIRVNNLGSTQRCSLSGIAARTFSDTAALIAHDDAGALWCEAMKFNVPHFPNVTGSEGVDLVHCLAVVFASCTLRGDPVFPLGAGGAGLVSSDSNIAAYDSRFEGAHGHDGFFDGMQQHQAGPGAAACVLSGGVWFASGSTLRGGDGGNGMPAYCYPTPVGGGNGAVGGNGLGANQPGTMILLDANVHGGHGGVGGPSDSECGMPAGAPGGQGANVAGAFARFTGESRKLTAPTLVREQHTLDIRIEGAPGDAVWLSKSSVTQWMLSPPRHGVALIAPPADTNFIGTIPTSGVLTLSLPVGDLGPGIDSKPVFMQALCVDTTGHVTLTSPAVVVLLDQAF